MESLKQCVQLRQISELKSHLAEARPTSLPCWPQEHAYQAALSEGLYRAVGLDWLEGVDILLEEGAPVNGCQYQGNLCISRDMLRHKGPTQTPLMLACRRGCYVIAEILIASGASVNAVDSLTCNTALRLAITNGHVNCTRTLLEHGADVNMTGKPYLSTSPQGISFFAPHTALIGAIRQFNGTIVPTLHNNRCTTNISETESQRDEWYGIVQLLVKHKVNINSPGCHTESSALVESVESPDTRVLAFLLASGAYVNQKTHVALQKRPLVDSALSLAAYLNNTDALRLLIQYGADAKEIDPNLVTFMVKHGYWKGMYFLMIAGTSISKSTRDAICGHKDTLRITLEEENSLGEHYTILKAMLSEPLPLSMQSRHTLRKETTLIKPDVARKVGLPKMIQEYIACADLC